MATKSFVENGTTPYEVKTETAVPVEVHVDEVTTPEQLENFAQDFDRRISDASAKVIESGATRMEGSVISAGGGPEDVEAGKSALGETGGEIIKLAENARADVLNVLQQELKDEDGAIAELQAQLAQRLAKKADLSAQAQALQEERASAQVVEPEPAPVSPEAALPESLKDEAVVEAEAIKQKISEFEFWAPANLRRGLNEVQVAAVNEAVTTFRNSRKEFDDMSRFQSTLNNGISGASWDSRGRLIMSAATEKWRYDQVADVWQKTVGDEVYSRRQAGPLREIRQRLNNGDFGNGGAKLGFGQYIDSLLLDVEKMPDLPFPPETAAMGKSEEAPAEIKQPLEHAVENIQQPAPASKIPGQTEIKTDMARQAQQTPEVARRAKLELLSGWIDSKLQYHPEVFSFPQELNGKHPLASKLFSKFLPKETPQNEAQKAELLGWRGLYGDYRKFLSEEAEYTRGEFAEVGLEKGYDEVRQYVDGYWERLDQEVKADYKGKVDQLMQKDLETDPEFETLPQNVKELMRIFNQEFYSGDSKVFIKLNDLMQKTGLKAFEAPNVARVLSDITLMNGPYTLTEKPSATDTDFFGVSSPDGSLYLVPKPFCTNGLVYERFNQHYTTGKDGGYGDPSASAEKKTPVKVLKPFVMRKNGDKYTLEKRGVFVAAA